MGWEFVGCTAIYKMTANNEKCVDTWQFVTKCTNSILLCEAWLAEE